jgi:cell division protein FtsQ
LHAAGTDSGFWWQMLDGPARQAATVAAALTAAPALAPQRQRPRARHKRSNSGLAALAAALAGALAFAILTDGGRSAREARPLIQELDRLAELAGFGLQQVSVTGHRFTPDADIFDAFDLANVRSLLRFDGAAVRARIERLPWVETASVTRVMPDQVRVHIVERMPFAVWQRGGRDMLIDATGRVLGPAADGSQWDLPRVAGEGAPAGAAEILALVGKDPELARRLAVVERIGERRWTLRLAGGPDIHLPAAGAVEALARLMAAHSEGRLLDPPTTVIDMRTGDRIAVRRGWADNGAGPVDPQGVRAVP